jgi:NCAIR mutase (PurE)-related protein
MSDAEDPSEVLDALLNGDLDKAQALEALQRAGVADLGYARLDMDRKRRRGVPETIYAAGKTPRQVGELFARLAAGEPNVLATRVAPDAAEVIQELTPEAEYDPLARVAWLHRDTEAKGQGDILVVAAGTSDLPVAREAEICSRVMGNETSLLADVGVAGLHRLLGKLEALRTARVLIVVAGMEGALPSVVAGLVDRPVVAVPTSIGYGAALGGAAALLGMLNSCAGGVAVVNIDNGFGAARCATLINRP